jgi:hypothetical protein
VRNDQYDKQVEEALREERERIWSLFDDSIFRSIADDEMIQEDYLIELARFKQEIFGEEK